MKINLTGHHVEVTQALEQAVSRDLSKIIKHYADIDSIRVILSVERDRHSAEIIVHYLGQDLVAKCSGEDMYKAITAMKNKAEVLLNKRKSQVKDHGHTRAAPEAEIEEQ